MPDGVDVLRDQPQAARSQSVVGLLDDPAQRVLDGITSTSTSPPCSASIAFVNVRWPTARRREEGEQRLSE